MNASTPPIDANDIDFLHESFVLFGDPDAPYWFLGLEEGDHPTKGQGIDAFTHHLLDKTRKFNENGNLSLRSFCGRDSKRYLPDFEASDARSGKNAKYQATWGGYIKLLLSVEMSGLEKGWNIEHVKQYQKYNLGELEESGGLPKSCLMELFPMARKGRKKGQWPYSPLKDRAGLEFMESPSTYQAYAEEKRGALFLSLVQKHQPKYVVCFGSDCKRVLMSQIDEEPELLQVDQGKKYMLVTSVAFAGTRIVFSNHPTSHHISNLYWKNLGTELAAT